MKLRTRETRRVIYEPIIWEVEIACLRSDRKLVGMARTWTPIIDVCVFKSRTAERPKQELLRHAEIHKLSDIM